MQIVMIAGIVLWTAPAWFNGQHDVGFAVTVASAAMYAFGLTVVLIAAALARTVKGATRLRR